MVNYLLITLGVVASALAQIFLKRSGQFDFLKEWNFFLFFVLGGLFYVLSFGLYTYLLKVFNLSKISPVMTVGTMILVILAGLLIFKESISIKQVAGIVLGIASILLIVS